MIFQRIVSQEEFDRLVERERIFRSAPGFVAEFPPSSLIDDSPEGIVRAFYRVELAKPPKE